MASLSGGLGPSVKWTSILFKTSPAPLLFVDLNRSVCALDLGLSRTILFVDPTGQYVLLIWALVEQQLVFRK